MLSATAITLAPTPYSLAAGKIKNGDLLFCSGSTLISRAIKQATQSPFSHVGLLLQLPTTEQWLVLESVESIGVRCVTLQEGYLTNYMGSRQGYTGQVYIGRHSALHEKQGYLSQLYGRAFSLLGEHYNEQDIFHIATRIALRHTGIDRQGKLIGSGGYICSEYIYACFSSIGIILPFDPSGFIAPSDIANNPAVSLILRLY